MKEKKVNKVLLKVLVGKDQKVWIKKTAKKDKISEAELIRAMLAIFISVGGKKINE